MNSKEIKSIVIGYYKQLYVNKLDNLVWWDIFLTKKDTNYWNSFEVKKEKL